MAIFDSRTMTVLRIVFLVFISWAPGVLANDDIACACFDGPCSPVVRTDNATVTYVIGGSAVAVDLGIQVFYSSSPLLSVAHLQFDGDGYFAGEDVLTFQDIANVTSSFDASSGSLFLYGPALPDDLQEAMRSVMYVNESPSPHIGIRTIHWTVSDDENFSGYTPSTVVVSPEAI